MWQDKARWVSPMGRGSTPRPGVCLCCIEMPLVDSIRPLWSIHSAEGVVSEENSTVRSVACRVFRFTACISCDEWCGGKYFGIQRRPPGRKCDLHDRGLV